MSPSLSLSLPRPLLRRSNVIARRTLSTSLPRSAPLAALKPTDEDHHTQIEHNSNMATRSAAQWADFGKDHISAGLGRLRDEVIVKGSGLELLTAEGKRYLDFTAGIGVTNLGQ